MTPAEQRLNDKAQRFLQIAKATTSAKKSVRYVRRFHETRRRLVKLQITLEYTAEEKQEYRCPKCHKTSTLAQAANYGIEARGIG